ncbi:MAG: enoyl-CoA hydratase/isomerase family protein [Actinobacteria bacterium]|jgi:2-(1,2-epoxy-1,2-dihydrophenyl)acetyl-CoA isomerase|nr:MAG: enoyl-CoA hydratase/isomerase family protein [Actinomycetota bacterium]
MDQKAFIVETVDGVARCSMNRPEDMNALSVELGYPMVEGLAQVLDDDSARVIILRGEGGHFCSGADLTLLGENLDPVFLNESMKALGEVILRLYEGPKPVITEVDGFAVGGGLGLALASDITYATERALFCMGFIRIAATPDMGSSYFLAERVGLARAKEMAFTGDLVGAEEAFRIGLVNKVVDHEEISREVMELAARIARRPHAALASTKRMLNRSHLLELQTVLSLESHVQPISLLSEEHRAAIRKIFARWEQGLGARDPD